LAKLTSKVIAINLAEPKTGSKDFFCQQGKNSFNLGSFKLEKRYKAKVKT